MFRASREVVGEEERRRRDRRRKEEKKRWMESGWREGKRFGLHEKRDGLER